MQSNKRNRLHNFLKYAQFARCLGVDGAYIRTNVKRGNIIADTEKKLIDAELSENKIWLEGQIANGKTWDLNRMNETNKKVIRNKSSQTTVKKVKKESENLQNKSESTKFDDYDLRVRELLYQEKIETLKSKQNQNRLKELEIQKKKGSLVPVDAVKGVFIFSIETLRTLYNQEINAMASIFSERLGAEEKHLKELQKDLNEKTNEIMREAKKLMIEGLESIITEYSEQRGRGESK